MLRAEGGPDARSQLLTGPFSVIAGFIWGLAEATVFFIVPDVWITLVALFSWRQSFKVLSATLMGALLGGSLMFWLGAHHPAQATVTVLHVPFVTQTMYDNTQHSFEQSGITALLTGTVKGIPYKIFAVQANRYSNWPIFILASVIARLERFLPFWIIAATLGAFFRKTTDRRPFLAVATHVCIWILGYAWYWSVVR